MKIFLTFGLALLFSLPACGQGFSGKFDGIFKTNGPSGSISISLPRVSPPTGDISISFDGQTATSKMTKLAFAAEDLSFSADLADSLINFRGSLSGGRIIGTFEGFEKGKRTFLGAYCAAREGGTRCVESDLPPLPGVSVAAQRADDAWDTSVAKPAYEKNGPTILFDEAHNNLHKASGNYKPFAELMRHDGYTVVANDKPFTKELLAGYKILAIVNARGASKDDASAFTDSEIDAVVNWVKKGGSLLFIADHTPMGGYAERLANRFGVDMSKGYTDDPQHRDPKLKDLLFSRENNLLSDHPITRGRNDSERIGRVVSFTGQSLKADRGDVILKLGDTAYDEFPNSDKKIPAVGRSQAIAMKFGKGKIFVGGEAAMFTAQISANDEKFGMNAAGTDDRQFALNVVHWLSGLLK